MNIKKVTIIILIMLISIGGYFVYKFIQNMNYENTDEMEFLDEIDVSKNSSKKTQEKEKISDKDDIEDESKENQDISEIEQNKIVIHIAGEVVNDGVFELNEGSRIVDAVNIAGGLTEDADVSKINLAYILSDEMKIYIPNIKDRNKTNVDEDKTEYITNENGDNVSERNRNESKEENELININNATQTELETLPGIGPSTALKIIKYREDNGNYTSIEDIKNVNGIGDSKFNNIKDLICV